MEDTLLNYINECEEGFLKLLESTYNKGVHPGLLNETHRVFKELSFCVGLLEYSINKNLNVSHETLSK